MARKAEKTRQDFERLCWDTDTAYRPPVDAPPHLAHLPTTSVLSQLVKLSPETASPDVVLHLLADAGSRVGLTAGDTGEIAVSFLKAIDATRSFSEAQQEIIEAFSAGRLRTLGGVRLFMLVEADAISSVASATAFACRREAMFEWLVTRPEDYLSP